MKNKWLAITLLIVVPLIIFAWWDIKVHAPIGPGSNLAPPLSQLNAQGAHLTFDSILCNDTAINGYVRAQFVEINMEYTSFYYVEDGSETEITVVGCDDTLTSGQPCKFTYENGNCSSCEAGDSIKVVILSTGRFSQQTISGCD